MSEQLPTPEPSSTQPAGETGEPDDFTFAERAKGRDFQTVLKQPVTIAAIFLTLGVIGLIFYLEGGRIYTELPPPEVSYEVLRNEGLTEGLPVAMKINQVSIFKIDAPMAAGGAERAREVQAALEGAIEDLVEEPGRTITIDLESAELPAIIQTKVDGSGRRVLVQLTEGDLVLAGTDDAKWLARVWAERVTDALKVMMFGEPPNFTQGTDFGAALTLLYDQAHVDGPVSRGSLDDAYENLPEPQQLALADFPPKPEDPLADPDGGAQE